VPIPEKGQTENLKYVVKIAFFAPICQYSNKKCIKNKFLIFLEKNDSF